VRLSQLTRRAPGQHRQDVPPLGGRPELHENPCWRLLRGYRLRCPCSSCALITFEAQNSSCNRLSWGVLWREWLVASITRS
jgi:hypothetical protein